MINELNIISLITKWKCTLIFNNKIHLSYLLKNEKEVFQFTT